MRILAFIIAIYSPVMLVIHVSTAKILRTWKQPDSWISRWFPPRCALRVEGVFWLLALASWFLWRSLAWKILVIVFAVIHLAIWAADEFRVSRKDGPAFTVSPAVTRAIVVFDAVEAVVLAGIGTVAIMYLVQGG